ncbi:hypothetical protein DPMN_119962 [Dreissena polymorpha]|uniref:Uncharacterized protein n=1 Tax=Dreissena polymorpha TaxID=45954 RepID=A0A9D4GNA0_DREPO|nr:hypothetical protein DPMN_119962 [Dreissena polymorpha]
MSLPNVLQHFLEFSPKKLYKYQPADKLIHFSEKDKEAKCNLTQASHLGGQFAKQLLLSMNPYAALCNQMLADVIGKLRTGEEME